MSDFKVVAIDDGHSDTKVAFFRNGNSGSNSDIVEFSFPSRVVAGMDFGAAMGGAEIDIDAYATWNEPPGVAARVGADNVFMVMGRGSRAEEATDLRFPGFPKSAENRIIVTHALKRVREWMVTEGQIGQDDRVTFRIATSLPYRQFYDGERSSAVNSALLVAKAENLLKPVMGLDPGTRRPFDLKFSITSEGALRPASVSEGLAAAFDVLLGQGEDMDQNFAGRFTGYAHQSFLVVDIGGKTTEIVFILWNGQKPIAHNLQLDLKRSDGREIGCLSAADELSASIKQRFKISRVLDPELALVRSETVVMGARHNIGDLCREAKSKVFGQLYRIITKQAGDGSDLAAAIFVGGGSELFREAISEIFPPALVVGVDNPQFANARGILKLLTTAV